MAPIVLRIKGAEGITRLAYLDSEEELSKTWKVCTKVKDSLVNGIRLENLSWRLWHLHKMMLSEQKNPTGRRRLDVKRVSNLTTRRLELDVDSAAAEGNNDDVIGGVGSVAQTNAAVEQELFKTSMNPSSDLNAPSKCYRLNSVPTVKGEIVLENRDVNTLLNDNRQTAVTNSNHVDESPATLKSYAVNAEVPILPGFENGIFLDDLFGGFSATAFLGSLEDGPRLEIPIDEFLDLNSLPSIDQSSASTAAALDCIPSHYDVLTLPLHNPNSFVSNHNYGGYHNSNTLLTGGSPSMDFFDDSALLHLQSAPRLKHVEHLSAENGLGIAAAEFSRPLPIHALAKDVFLTSSSAIAAAAALPSTQSSAPVTNGALDPLMIYQYQPTLIQQRARISDKHQPQSPTLSSSASVVSASDTALHAARKRPTLDDFCNQQCVNCGVRSTPLWRRNEKDEVLCNACGLYLKMHKSSRPQTLKEIASRRAAVAEPVQNICFNCQTVNTPLWRKGDDGTVLCNACGLYWKIHKEHRPLEGSRKRKRPSTGAESPTSSPPVTTVHQAFSATQQQRQQQQSPLIAMNYSKLLLAIQQQQQKNFHS